MGATAEDRVAKRKINELEQKLKKLQRELKEIKLEKKHVGHLRKQAERAVILEADCKEILEEVEADLLENDTKIKKEATKPAYKCKNAECISAGGYYETSGNCDIIEAGVRVIVICRDCGARYSVEAQVPPSP